MPKHTWSRGEDVTPGDPWSFQRWAYQTKVGSPARKAVLMVLATMADSNTGRCEPLQETLAEACETSDRTIREHLKHMEAAGIITRRRQHRYDGSRRGDEFLILAPWVTEWPDGVKVRLTEESSAPPTGSSASSLPEDFDRSNRKPASAQERPEVTTKKEQRPTADIAREPQVTFLRKPVPERLATEAVKAVQAWGERTDQKLKAFTARGKQTDSLTRVVGAMLDFPEAIDLWPSMIDAALRDPWWHDSAPGIGVVFGPKAVEQSIQRARQPAIAASAGSNVHRIGSGTRFERAQAGWKELHDQLVAEGR